MFADTPHAAPSRTFETLFVGRRRELDSLRAAFAGATRGRAGVLLLTGEPGIGKTRLAAEFAAECQVVGARVVWGRCWDWGGAPAFWPWVQVVRALTARMDGAALRQHLGPGACHLAALVPEIAERLPDLPPPPAMDPARARFELFDAIACLLRRCAQDAPLVILLDDLHGADGASLTLLRFLGRDAEAASLLFVGTCRTVDARPTPEVATLLAELSREVTLVPLAGLADAELASFLEDASGRHADATRVHALRAATGGNPLFVRGVVGSAIARGDLEAVARDGFSVPDSVRGAIQSRLARLSEPALLMLRVASVIGRACPLALLQQLRGEPLSSMLEHLSEVTAAGLLVEVPGEIGRYAFSHGLFREVLYEALDPHERMLAHLRVGEALEELYGALRPSHHAELARHFLAAAALGVAAKAIDYTVAAGERATALSAFEESAEHHRRALGALDWLGSAAQARRIEILTMLGDAELAAGRPADARRSFAEAAELARTRSDAAAFALAALGFARTGEFGVLEGAKVRLLEQASDGLGTADSALLARVLARLGMEMWSTPGAEPRGAALTEHAVGMARRLGDAETLALALNARLQSVWGPEHLNERLDITRELEQLARRSDNLERVLEAHRWRLNALVEVGDLAAAGAEVAAYTRVAEALRRPQYLFNAMIRQAMPLQLAGRHAELRELSRRTCEVGRRAGDGQADLIDASRRVLEHDELGEDGPIDAALRELAPHVERLANFPMYRGILLRGLLAVGRDDEARAEWDRHFAHDLRDLPRNMTTLATLALITPACVHFADPRRSARVYELLLPYEALHAAIGASYSFGATARYLGLLALSLGRVGDACAQLEAAVTRNGAMGARTWTAHSKHDLAVALRARSAAGDVERAAALDSAALRTAEELGLRRLSETIRRAPTPTLAAALPPVSSGVFRRTGATWTVGMDGRRFEVKDARGMSYLERLLEHPGTEFHVLELIGASAGDGTAVRAREGDGSAVLDARAKAAYRARIEQLREAIADADARADVGWLERARTELDLVTDELAAAMGLGGRDRALGSSAEKGRVSVAKAIGRAVRAITKFDPGLGRHLESSVKTGLFCAYDPEPRARVDWTV